MCKTDRWKCTPSQPVLSLGTSSSEFHLQLLISFLPKTFLASVKYMKALPASKFNFVYSEKLPLCLEAGFPIKVALACTIPKILLHFRHKRKPSWRVRAMEVDIGSKTIRRPSEQTFWKHGYNNENWQRQFTDWFAAALYLYVKLERLISARSARKTALFWFTVRKPSVWSI